MASRTKKRNGRKIKRISLQELWNREGGICCLCGNPVSMIYATREHKTSRARGGKDGRNYSNLGIAHEFCNRKKDSDTWGFHG